jgi:hypothetical protein
VSAPAAAAAGLEISNSAEDVAAAAAADPSAEQLTELAGIVMGWYSEPEDAVCLVLQSAGDSRQQQQQPHSAAAGASASAAVADAPCKAKPICGVGYSRLQRDDSLQEQQQQQEAETKEILAAAAEPAPAVDAVMKETEMPGQQQHSCKVLHVEAAAVVDVQQHTSTCTLVKSAHLLSDSSLLSPFWVAATTAEDAAAEQQEDLVDASDAAAATAATSDFAAAAPFTVEELLAATEAIIAQLDKAFAGVQLTATLLKEARMPLRERYCS